MSASIARASLVTVLLAAACDRAARPVDAGTRALASRASGVWDAQIRLTRTPLGPAAADAPVARGSVALLASEARDVRGGDASDALRRPVTHVGVYALDLRPLGFVPSAPGGVPALVAVVVSPDSLVAATPPGADGGSFELRGRLNPRADAVVGTWSYATRGAGAWGGAFTLRRR